jgi:hypothetical protein
MHAVTDTGSPLAQAQGKVGEGKRKIKHEMPARATPRRDFLSEAISASRVGWIAGAGREQDVHTTIDDAHDALDDQGGGYVHGYNLRTPGCG